MSNLFKFFVNRAAEEFPKAELEKLSIPTHSGNNQSEWFKILERLCEQKDFKGIISEILNYLPSKNAIHSTEQLDNDFKAVFDYVERQGTIKTKKDREELLKIVDLRKIADYFKEQDLKIEDENGKSKTVKMSKFNLELQQVSDTILSLAILGKLGNKENLNYNLIFKVFHLLKLLFDKKKEVSLPEIMQLFDKTTTLPSCFFKLNPCSKKLEPVQIGKPFTHLGIMNFNEDEIKPRILEIKGKIIDLGVNILAPEIKDPRIPSTTKPDCECNCDESCKGQNPCCASIKPFITDLMVVREELYCYKAKHLAYVETIMLGEERVREHRHLERTENYSENETTLTKSEEKDHQVSERFSLQTESAKTIESDLSLDAGVTANAWGTGYSVNTSLDVSSQNSKAESQRVAREQAVDITERTVRKIQETVRELTTKKKIVETEEKNSHSFKNNTSDSKKHINGMYQFINAEYKGQVMNYGKRLMFEFILPEPMELYKKLMSKQINPFGLKEPTRPSLSPKDINEDNYLDLAKTYNISDIPLPLQQNKILTFSFGNNTVLNRDNEAESSYDQLNIGTVPEGYTARIIEVDFRGSDNPEDNEVSEVVLFVGKDHFQGGGYQAKDIEFTENEKIVGSLKSLGTTSVSGSGIVRCKRNEDVYNNWKIGVYNKIILKYEKDLNEYKAELARYNADKDEKTKLGRNPFINRATERDELKRMAISFISCQFYDQFTAMKRNVKPCGYPQMDLEQAEKDGKFIQFFEQLFDWNLMTYLFYPYFWGQKCDWANKIQEDSGDPLFDKALMAGAGRVQVPVKSGHEPLAMHWITFGEIWQGTGQPPVPGSPYYISIAQEIKEQKGVFYADREGELQVWNNQDVLTLINSAYYWDYSTGAINQLNIDNDIDREIILDCVTYRIVDIEEDTTDVSHETWKITIERAYEGADQSNLKWSTGALFVGAEFLITVPTNLVYLKNKKLDGEYVTEDCLPCFPQPKCD
jgi:hypothetical protein